MCILHSLSAIIIFNEVDYTCALDYNVSWVATEFKLTEYNFKDGFTVLGLFMVFNATFNNILSIS